MSVEVKRADGRSPHRVLITAWKTGVAAGWATVPMNRGHWFLCVSRVGCLPTQGRRGETVVAFFRFRFAVMYPVLFEKVK